MKTKPRQKPRRRLARPLLMVVGALSLGAMIAGCDDDTSAAPNYDLLPGNNFQHPDLSTKDR